jgi:hypothetical protein
MAEPARWLQKRQQQTSPLSRLSKMDPKTVLLSSEVESQIIASVMETISSGSARYQSP